MKLLVAVPALNEEKSISNVIHEIHKYLPQASVLVVDDGSIDNTANIARAAGAIVISLPFNLGVGGAIRSAFKYAYRNNFTHVLQIDADGQHLPSEAIQLIAFSEPDSLVIGSRFLSASTEYETELSRKFAMKTLAKITSLICETRLTDVTSGFRLCTGKAIELFAKDYPREYLGDTVESLIIAHKAGVNINEVSVIMRHREHGKPSQNLIKSGWYLLRITLIILLAFLKK